MMNKNKKIKDILIKIPKQNKIKKSEYKESGLIPIIDQGEKFISGYTNDSKYESKCNLPVIVFGDHTRIFKFITFPFASGADGIQILRPNSDFDIKYFYYCLKNLNIKNHGYARHFKYLKEETVIQRPLSEQLKIGSILYKFDNLIEINNKRISLLEELIESIYVDWFINFKFPGYESTQILESEEGLIPQGWAIVSIESIVKRFPFGQVYTQKDVQKYGEVAVYDQSTNEILGFHNNKPDHIATSHNPIIIFGDHTCKMEILIEPFSLGPNVVPFVANSKYSTYFIFYSIKNKIKTQEYKRHWNDLISKKILLPDNHLSNLFSQIIKPIIEQKSIFKKTNSYLRNMSNLLLPKLSSGEIDLSNVDITE